MSKLKAIGVGIVAGALVLGGLGGKKLAELDAKLQATQMDINQLSLMQVQQNQLNEKIITVILKENARIKALENNNNTNNKPGEG